MMEQAEKKSLAPNPYQTPVEASALAHGDWGNYIDGVLRFDVSIDRRTVRRLYPRSNTWIYICVAFLAFLLLFGRDRSTGGPPYLFVFLLALPIFVVLLIRQLQMFLLVRQMTTITERYSGWIDASGLATKSDRSESYVGWSDFYGIKLTKQCVVLRYDRWHLAAHIIPWEAFELPEEAKAVFKSVCEQRKQLAPAEIGDVRMAVKYTAPFRWQPPEEFVAFEGDITFQDLSNALPGKKIKRQLRLYLFFGACAIPFSVLCPILLGANTFIFTLPIVFVSFVLAFAAMKHPFMSKDKDQVAFRTRGWVSPHGLVTGVASRQSDSKWTAFAGQWHNAQHLCIRMRGFGSVWCFLVRSQFASDEEFAQACEWAAAGLQ